MVDNYSNNQDLIIFTRDWHDPNAPFFTSQSDPEKGLWVPHCVMNTWGAEFIYSHWNDLIRKHGYEVVNKGYQTVREQYDATESTQFIQALINLVSNNNVSKITKVEIIGVAREFCVESTFQGFCRKKSIFERIVGVEIGPIEVVEDATVRAYYEGQGG